MNLLQDTGNFDNVTHMPHITTRSLSRVILGKAKKFQQEGTDEAWTGIEVITQK